MRLTANAAISCVVTLAMVLYLPADCRAMTQDQKTLTGRLRLAQKPSCLIVEVILTNSTGAEVEVAIGNASQKIGPTFYCSGQWLSPAEWTSPGRRVEPPVFLKLPPGKEVVYGSYTCPYPQLPPGEYNFEGQIYLRASGRLDYQYIANMKPEKITIRAEGTQ